MNSAKEESADDLDCPNCGSNAFHRATDNKRGEVSCTKCGYVIIEQKFDERPEWRSFDSEELNKRARTGGPTGFMIPDKGLSTIIGYENKDTFGNKLSAERRAQVYRLRKWQTKTRVYGENVNLAEAMSELERLSSQLEIPRSVKETAALIYRKALKKRLVRSCSVDAMVAAALYASARIRRIPRTLDEIAEESKISKKELGKFYRCLLKKTYLNIPLPTPADYIPRFGTELNLPGKVQKDAADILKKARAKGIIQGKGPAGMAAAALYLSGVLNDERRTQREIAKIAHVTEVTIRNRYKELVRKLYLEITAMNNDYSNTNKAVEFIKTGEVNPANNIFEKFYYKHPETSYLKDRIKELYDKDLRFSGDETKLIVALLAAMNVMNGSPALEELVSQYTDMSSSYLKTRYDEFLNKKRLVELITPISFYLNDLFENEVSKLELSQNLREKIREESFSVSDRIVEHALKYSKKSNESLIDRKSILTSKNSQDLAKSIICGLYSEQCFMNLRALTDVFGTSFKFIKENLGNIRNNLGINLYMQPLELIGRKHSNNYSVNTIEELVNDLKIHEKKEELIDLSKKLVDSACRNDDVGALDGMNKNTLNLAAIKLASEITKPNIPYRIIHETFGPAIKTLYRYVKLIHCHADRGLLECES